MQAVSLCQPTTFKASIEKERKERDRERSQLLPLPRTMMKIFFLSIVVAAIAAAPTVSATEAATLSSRDRSILGDADARSLRRYHDDDDAVASGNGDSKNQSSAAQGPAAPCNTTVADAFVWGLTDYKKVRPSYFEACLGSLEVDKDNMIQEIHMTKETFKQY